MDYKTLLLAILSLVGWGLSAFIAKLATNRIGERAIFWDMIGYAPAIIIYSLLMFKVKDLFQSENSVFFWRFSRVSPALLVSLVFTFF